MKCIFFIDTPFLDKFANTPLLLYTLQKCMYIQI